MAFWDGVVDFLGKSIRLRLIMARHTPRQLFHLHGEMQYSHFNQSIFDDKVKRLASIGHQ